MANPIDLQFIVNETQVSPVDWELIGFTADLTVDFAELELTESTLEFTKKNDLNLLHSILDDKGLEAAIPMKVVVPSNDPNVAPLEEEFLLTVVDSLAITDTSLFFGVERRYGVSRFIARADKTTWDIINDQTPITGAVPFPYREVDPRPNDKLVMLEIQLGTSLIAFYDSVTGVANAVAAVAGGLTGLAESIAQLIIEAARAILLGVVIATTSKQIFRIFFPKQKYFYEIKDRDLIRQGCEFLGYTLQSTLLDNYANMGTIPVPILDTNKTFLENVIDDVSYYNGKYPTAQDGVLATFGGFFKEIKKLLNAQVMIIGQTIIFENESYFQNNPVESIKESLTEQEDLQNLRRYNLDEVWFHKILAYKTDFSDRYTMDKIDGIAAEYKTVYTGTADPDLVNIESSKRIDVAFSLTRRKDQLSYFDEQALIFGAIVDNITSFFSNGTNLVGSVLSSIGQMLISDQHFVTTKKTWAIGGKQTPDFVERIGAKAIYEANHTNLQVKENFQERKEMTVPFSVENFRNLVNGRYVLNQNNKSLKVLNHSWLPYNSEITLKLGEYVPEKSKTQTVLING